MWLAACCPSHWLPKFFPLHLTSLPPPLGSSKSSMSARPMGPYWRASINALLSDSPCISHFSPSTISSAKLVTIEASESRYLELPTELRDMVDEHLSPVDLFCLDQTCRQLRTESSRSRDLTKLSLNPLQSHSLQARLDRECLPLLYRLEHDGVLDADYAVCGFCTYVHQREHFMPRQLDAAPATRYCDSAIGSFSYVATIRPTCESSFKYAII